MNQVIITKIKDSVYNTFKKEQIFILEDLPQVIEFSELSFLETYFSILREVYNNYFTSVCKTLIFLEDLENQQTKEIYIKFNRERTNSVNKSINLLTLTNIKIWKFLIEIKTGKDSIFFDLQSLYTDCVTATKISTIIEDKTEELKFAKSVVRGEHLFYNKEKYTIANFSRKEKSQHLIPDKKLISYKESADLTKSIFEDIFKFNIIKLLAERPKTPRSAKRTKLQNYIEKSPRTPSEQRIPVTRVEFDNVIPFVLEPEEEVGSFNSLLINNPIFAEENKSRENIIESEFWKFNKILENNQKNLHSIESKEFLKKEKREKLRRKILEKERKRKELEIAEEEIKIKEENKELSEEDLNWFNPVEEGTIKEIESNIFFEMSDTPTNAENPSAVTARAVGNLTDLWMNLTLFLQEEEVDLNPARYAGKNPAELRIWMDRHCTMKDYHDIKHYSAFYGMRGNLTDRSAERSKDPATVRSWRTGVNDALVRLRSINQDLSKYKHTDIPHAYPEFTIAGITSFDDPRERFNALKTHWLVKLSGLVQKEEYISYVKVWAEKRKILPPKLDGLMTLKVLQWDSAEEWISRLPIKTVSMLMKVVEGVVNENQTGANSFKNIRFSETPTIKKLPRGFLVHPEALDYVKGISPTTFAALSYILKRKYKNVVFTDEQFETLRGEVKKFKFDEHPVFEPIEPTRSAHSLALDF